MAEHPLKPTPAGWPAAWRTSHSPENHFRSVKTLTSRTANRASAVARLEAVLFVADGPLTARRIARYAMLPGPAEAKLAINDLNQAYDEGRSAFRVERVAAGYRLLTRPELAPWLNRLHRQRGRTGLSPPALETLTIVAYRGPCTRADVEAIRGVQSAEMLKYLLERGLIRISGEHESLGRPYLYATTKQFLETFGFKSVADLPRAAELRSAENDDPTKQDSEKTKE